MTDLIETPRSALIEASADPLKKMLAELESVKEVGGEAVDLMERLHKMHVAEREYNARMDFNDAFMAICDEIEPVAKQAWNEQTKSYYAKLHHVEAMLNPILKRHGFKVSVTPDISDKGTDWTRFTFVARHRNGHVETHQADAPLDYSGIKGGANKTKIHGLNSTHTQMQKRMILGYFGIELSDDRDGNRVVDSINEKQQLEIAALVAHTGTDMQKFLKPWGVAKLPDLPVDCFVPALNFLKHKAKGQT